MCLHESNRQFSINISILCIMQTRMPNVIAIQMGPPLSHLYLVTSCDYNIVTQIIQSSHAAA